MNTAVVKILNEFEVSHGFGAVEIIYNIGLAVTVHIKRTLKMTSNETNRPREYRGPNGGNEQH